MSSAASLTYEEFEVQPSPLAAEALQRATQCELQLEGLRREMEVRMEEMRAMIGATTTARGRERERERARESGGAI